MHDMSERIAVLAHDLWRKKMARDGWTPGPEYDPETKRHDAMVPFDALGKYDRRQTFIGVEAECLERTLSDTIYYERGPGRLFTAEEMRVGFPVESNNERMPPETPVEKGRVVDWQVGEDGILRSITVAWDDGTRDEYDPEARELSRAEEPPR